MYIVNISFLFKKEIKLRNSNECYEKTLPRTWVEAELKSKIKSGITNNFVSLMQRQRVIQLSCNFFIHDFTNMNGNH